MAETPNNDIEKQLRKYAQQRRDAAGTPTLHPATRAMLQAEVKQRHAAPPPAPAPAQRSGWAIFWPRFAFAFAIVVVLGLVGIFVFPPGDRAKDKFALAGMEAAQPMVLSATETNNVLALVAEPPSASPASAPLASAPVARREIMAKSAGVASAAVPDTYAVDKSPRTEAPASRIEPAKAFKGGTAQSARKDLPVQSSFAAASSDFAAKEETRTPALASDAKAINPTYEINGAPETARVRTADGLSIQPQTTATLGYVETRDRAIAVAGKLDGTKSKSAPRVQIQNRTLNDNLNSPSQRFYRNVAVTDELKKSGKITVLDEFTVEQNGNALTVVDRDGSIYNGYARPADAERQNLNAASGNPIQLVPNSASGGRAGAMWNKGSMNRSESNLGLPPAGSAQNFAGNTASPVPNTPTALNYFFRVEGTNRSLNQRVVLTGNLLQNNSAAQNAGINQTFRNQQNFSPGIQYNFNQQSFPQSNFINGRVQLDNTKPVEFNALSTDP